MMKKRTLRFGRIKPKADTRTVINVLHTPKFILQLLLFPLVGFIIACNKKENAPIARPVEKKITIQNTDGTLVDTADYGRRLRALHDPDTVSARIKSVSYPASGAILPYKRIIAFYGNLYSKKMGILGALPKNEMLLKLQNIAKQWELADPGIPTVPALHYIAVTAQSRPGKNNKYRLRMPHRQIDTILAWADSINALVFLDVQAGQSSITEEVYTLTSYLELPNVHLAIDPEFAMKNGAVPGTKIGTLSSSEINQVTAILSNIVKENRLPPKILVVHRFTKAMVTDYKNITTCPEVQIVMNMDGFGSKALKRSSYNMAIYREPVQFTGFKLFFKNDTKNGQPLYTPQELLKFKPKPIYIQYQ